MPTIDFSGNTLTVDTVTAAVTGAITGNVTGNVTGTHYPATDDVTATADGLTTGIIADGTQWVNITSANAAHIVTLPASSAAYVGLEIRGWVGANGCELQTPTTASATINGVDCSGENEAAIPATSMIHLTLVAVDTWLLEVKSELGAVVTAIIPDTTA